MHTDALSVVGPDLRVFASGELKIADEPNQVDAEVALFLFRQIDNVLDKIPLLNLLLLGSDESLVAAHFTLRGDWNDPEAKLVPLRSFASGPAGIVLEAIPFFLRKGIEAIEGMLGGRRRHERLSPAPPPAPTPKES